MKERRDFIKAFVASAGALTFSKAATAQSVSPVITLLLLEDPQFVISSARSATAKVATPFLFSGPVDDNVQVLLSRPVT